MENVKKFEGGVYLSVVIPAYNEEKRLPRTLKSVVEYLKEKDYSWEVAVVDDGSSDKTADVVREVAVHESRVRLLQYGENRGKGYAVKYGMTHVSGKYRLFMDADNSTTIDHIEDMIPYFDKNYDLMMELRITVGQYNQMKGFIENRQSEVIEYDKNTKTWKYKGKTEE